MFDYLKQVEKRENRIEPEMKLNIVDNVRINVDKIKTLNVNEYSDEGLNQLCRESYDRILKYTLTDSEAIKRLLLNDRFVMAFSNAMYNVILDESQKLRLCNIIYATRAIANTDIINNFQKALLLNLGCIIHGKIMPVIMGIGFNKDLAGELIIARYSSFKTSTQVKRINHFLLTIKEEIEVNSIIKLFEVLGYFSHFSDLFEGIMYDAINPASLTDHQKEIYATINIALLDIMEEMPTNLLYTLILNFVDMAFMRPNDAIRFNIGSCSVTDYPRINATIRTVENEGKMIPYSNN